MPRDASQVADGQRGGQVILPRRAYGFAGVIGGSVQKVSADSREGLSPTIWCVCSIHTGAGGGARESIH